MAHAGGRPTDYKVEYNEQAFKLCLLGATDAEIADFFGVEESTVNNWKIKHPKFLESLKNGKIKADAEVAESLRKRANGYKYTEKTFENGELTKETEKEVSPDTGACMAWLKNRQPKKWRDKQDLDIVSNNVNANLNTDIPPTELEAKISDLLQKYNQQ